MKKIMLLMVLTIFSLTQATAAPGESLLQLFNHTFPEAKYIRWTHEKEYHVVSFTMNDISCRIYYDNENKLIYSLRYYKENELPLAVLIAVKKKYHDKNIGGITELTTRSNVSYEVLVSDDKEWYVINVTADGNLSLKYTLRKQ